MDSHLLLTLFLKLPSECVFLDRLFFVVIICWIKCIDFIKFTIIRMKTEWRKIPQTIKFLDNTMKLAERKQIGLAIKLSVMNRWRNKWTDYSFRQAGERVT